MSAPHRDWHLSEACFLDRPRPGEPVALEKQGNLPQSTLRRRTRVLVNRNHQVVYCGGNPVKDVTGLIFIIRPELDDDLFGGAVDVAHQRDLVVAFGNVFLVDA